VGIDPRLRVDPRIEKGRLGGPVLSSPVPIRLERELDVDEEWDLDRDLEAEFPFAEEVTHDVSQGAETTAGGGEELCELLHDDFSCRLRFIAGMKSGSDKEGCTFRTKRSGEPAAARILAREEAEGGENSGGRRLQHDGWDAPSLMSMKFDRQEIATARTLRTLAAETAA
jgi:hypothetical protein